MNLPPSDISKPPLFTANSAAQLPSIVLQENITQRSQEHYNQYLNDQSSIEEEAPEVDVVEMGKTVRSSLRADIPRPNRKKFGDQNKI